MRNRDALTRTPNALGWVSGWIEIGSSASAWRRDQGVALLASGELVDAPGSAREMDDGRTMDGDDHCC